MSKKKHKHKDQEPVSSEVDPEETTAERDKRVDHDCIRTLERLLDAEEDAPVNPDSCRHYNRQNSAWKFYTKIRLSLPNWWSEFNERLDEKTGRLKYRSLHRLVKVMTKRSQEREWLMIMLGPEPTRAQMKEVPWLGDWERRRENGFSGLRNLKKFKPLARAITSNLAAGEAIRASAPLLLKEYMRYERMQNKIEHAFGGDVFSEKHPVTHSENQKRSKAYFSMMNAITQMKMRLIHEWMRVHGVNPDQPHEMNDMMLMAGQVGMAAAMTGVAAGSRMFGNPQQPGIPQLPSGDGETAILLAQHLMDHERTFKRPNPVLERMRTIQAEVESESSDSSSHHKSNGREKLQ